jgi:hypothetical protein
VRAIPRSYGSSRGVLDHGLPVAVLLVGFALWVFAVRDRDPRTSR